MGISRLTDSRHLVLHHVPTLSAPKGWRRSVADGDNGRHQLGAGHGWAACEKYVGWNTAWALLKIHDVPFVPGQIWEPPDRAGSQHIRQVQCGSSRRRMSFNEVGREPGRISSLPGPKLSGDNGLRQRRGTRPYPQIGIPLRLHALRIGTAEDTMSVAARERPLMIGEVSRILGMHPQRIRRLERRGELPQPRRETATATRYDLPDEVRAMRERLDETA